MHMPDAIPENMFAPCGMNCMVCYKHCTVCKSVRPCAGCLNGDEGKPRHCRACAIRDCCREKGLRYCLECTAFPCRRLNRLEKKLSYALRRQSFCPTAAPFSHAGLPSFWRMNGKNIPVPCAAALFRCMTVCAEPAAHPRPRWNRSMRCAVPVAEKGTFPLRDFCAILFFVAASVSAHKGAGTPGGRGKIRAAAAGMK